jgi:enoyl-CoA hydratase/carnithine racemase
MSDTESPKVLVEREDGVGVITINRPDVRNVVDPEVSSGIEAALDEFDADREVRAVVLTGAGEKAI